MKLSRKSRVMIFLHIKNEKELLSLTEAVVSAIDGKQAEIGLLTNLVKYHGQNFYTKMVIEKGEYSALLIEQKPMTMILSELDLRLVLAQLEVFADPTKTFKSAPPELVIKDNKVALCLNYKDMMSIN